MFKFLKAIRTLQSQVAEQQTTITDLQAKVREYTDKVTALVTQDEVISQLRDMNKHTHYVAHATKQERVRQGHER
jgi:uncharacterized coiled-coil protein SlyX